MRPVPPLDPGLVDQPEVRFVHQARGAQGVAWPLAAKLRVRQSPELIVDHREQPVGRTGVALRSWRSRSVTWPDPSVTAGGGPVDTGGKEGIRSLPKKPVPVSKMHASG